MLRPRSSGDTGSVITKLRHRDTTAVHRNAVKGVDNAMPCHRSEYGKHNIRNASDPDTAVVNDRKNERQRKEHKEKRTQRKETRTKKDKKNKRKYSPAFRIVVTIKYKVHQGGKERSHTGH